MERIQIMKYKNKYPDSFKEQLPKYSEDRKLKLITLMKVKSGLLEKEEVKPKKIE